MKLSHIRIKGYIALISVILLGALSTVVMISVISQSITSSKTDFSLQQTAQARVLAGACVEEALQIILETGTTSRASSLSYASGTCSYSIISTSSSLFIQSTGSTGSVTRKVLVEIATTTPSIVLSSWQDVADF